MKLKHIDYQLFSTSSAGKTLTDMYFMAQDETYRKALTSQMYEEVFNPSVGVV